MCYAIHGFIVHRVIDLCHRFLGILLAKYNHTIVDKMSILKDMNRDLTFITLLRTFNVCILLVRVFLMHSDASLKLKEKCVGVSLVLLLKYQQ